MRRCAKARDEELYFRHGGIFVFSATSTFSGMVAMATFSKITAMAMFLK
jgi:hypothetical protein